MTESKRPPRVIEAVSSGHLDPRAEPMTVPPPSGAPRRSRKPPEPETAASSDADKRTEGIAALRKQIAAMQKSLSAELDARAEDAERIEGLEANVRRLEEQLATSATRAEQLTVAANEARDQIARAEQDATALREQIAAREAEVSAMLAAREAEVASTLAAREAEVSAMLAARDAEVLSLSERAHALDGQLEAQGLALEATRASSAEREAALAATTLEVEGRLGGRVGELEGELAARVSELDAQRHAEAAMNDQLRELIDELQTARGAIAQAEQRESGLFDHIASMERDVAVLRRDLGAEREAVEKLTRSLEEERAQSAKRASALSEATEALRGLARAEKELAAAREHVGEVLERQAHAARVTEGEPRRAAPPPLPRPRAAEPAADADPVLEVQPAVDADPELEVQPAVDADPELEIEDSNLEMLNEVSLPPKA